MAAAVTSQQGVTMWPQEEMPLPFPPSASQSPSPEEELRGRIPWEDSSGQIQHEELWVMAQKIHDQPNGSSAIHGGVPDWQNPKTGVFHSYSKCNRHHASSSYYSQWHYYPHFTDGETRIQREVTCQAKLGSWFKLVSMQREQLF